MKARSVSVSPERRLRLVRSPYALPAEDDRGRTGTPAPQGKPPAVDSRSAEPPAIEQIYSEYARYVAAMASRVLGRVAEVDDVVQEVFAAAVHGLRRRDDDREVKAWLAKVTVRRCIRHLRLRRLWSLVDRGQANTYDDLAEPSAGPAERLLVAEVYGALDRIPTRERVPWTLRHVEGESLERISVLCGRSLATIKRRIAQAHQKLLMHLSENRS
jgi:RNA polymerase sigma-70 factor, ECF subfamily